MRIRLAFPRSKDREEALPAPKVAMLQPAGQPSWKERMRRTYGFSFSWRRTVGIAAAKGRLSRAIGVPLTQGGRERKLGRMVSSWLGAGLVIAILAILSKL
jgi:hypothetical protein